MFRQLPEEVQETCYKQHFYLLVSIFIDCFKTSCVVVTEFRSYTLRRSPGGTPLVKNSTKPAADARTTDPQAIIAAALRRKFAHRAAQCSPEKDSTNRYTYCKNISQMVIMGDVSEQLFTRGAFRWNTWEIIKCSRGPVVRQRNYKQLVSGSNPIRAIGGTGRASNQICSCATARKVCRLTQKSIDF